MTDDPGTGGDRSSPGGNATREGGDGAGEDDGDRIARTVQRLHEVATRMQSATTPVEVHELAVEAGTDLFGFDWCLFEVPKRGRFEITAASEASPVEPGDRPMGVDHGVTGQSYRTGEVVVTPDVHADPTAAPTQEAFRSGLTVPVGDHGVFQGISSVPGYFDEDDRELAELLVAHAEAAIDRIEHARRIERLHGATRELMGAETREGIARVGSETASTVLPAPLNVVLLYDPDADALVPAAASGDAREHYGDPPAVGPGEGVAWRVYREGTTEVSGDVGGGSGGYAPDAGTRSELLTALGEYGVLVAGSTAPDEFDDEDVALAETLAANVTAALDRAGRERELRSQRRRLRRQNDRLDRFAAAVSHDLRNPLVAARASVELADEDCDSDRLDDALDALDRTRSIVEDTLALAREGRTVDDREPVDLAALARESWATVETGGATLDVEGTRRVDADPDRLRHVFENLFRNCVEHAVTGDRPDGTGDAGGSETSLTVRVGTLTGGFYVADDGPGIDPDEREDVFETGYSTAEDGTGFGLTIVQEIVEAHGWTIGVAEGTEGGARFEVTGVE